jgi:carboxymethylenebutenolidase
MHSLEPASQENIPGALVSMPVSTDVQGVDSDRAAANRCAQTDDSPRDIRRRMIRRFERSFLCPGGALLAIVLLAGCDAPRGDRRSPAFGAADTVEFASGPLRLRGLVFRPAGAGRHPAVLFMHGSGGDYEQAVAAVAPLYSRHGYLLFIPFRRGQGLSVGQGEAITDRLAREARANGTAARFRLMDDLLATEQMDDVLAALAYLKRRADVDSTRIAVAGNSFGGILSVFSAERAPGIRAAVASAPGALTWADAPELRDRLRAAARNARVPVFFFQAANDRNLDPTEQLAAEMTRAGRVNVRKIYPAFGRTWRDGHSFGYFGGEAWGPDVFAFLAEHLASLPTRP